jgi:hypothetical protein
MEPPASLLPTLVSAFLANSYEELYLPVNLLAFASCGSDIRATACERHAEFARSAKDVLLKEPPSEVLALGARPSRGTGPVAQSGTVLPR